MRCFHFHHVKLLLSIASFVAFFPSSGRCFHLGDNNNRNGITFVHLRSTGPFTVTNAGNFPPSCRSNRCGPTPSYVLSNQLVTKAISDDNAATTNSNNNNKSWSNLLLFGSISFFYWYWMVLGAAAKTNGLPFIPDFLPMTPGWPVSDADMAPVLEDSFHFFYLSELLQNSDAPYVIPPRLAVFNFVEAWVFALLPALWSDPNRAPRPVLLSTWALLGINLTNAFMAPYLFVTEAMKGNDSSSSSSIAAPYPKNRLVSILFGSIASVVVSYAGFQCLTVATAQDWSEFWTLVQTDRSYLAFCIDPIVLSIFQPFILSRVKQQESQSSLDYIPFIGLIAWLFSDNDINE